MKAFLKRLFRDEAGQGLSEYGLIIGLVAIALVVALATMTGALQDIFDRISDALTNAPEVEPPAGG